MTKSLDEMILEMISVLGKEKVISFLECARYMYSCLYYGNNDLDAIGLCHYIDDKIGELTNV